MPNTTDFNLENPVLDQIAALFFPPPSIWKGCLANMPANMHGAKHIRYQTIYVKFDF